MVVQGDGASDGLEGVCPCLQRGREMERCQVGGVREHFVEFDRHAIAQLVLWSLVTAGFLAGLLDGAYS